MILAAGKGKRMLPLTENMPKPLLKVKGKALIEHHLCAFAKANIRNIVINLGYLGEKIKTFLGSGEQYGVRIEYSDEDPILETGGGILKALPLLKSDPFVVVSADIFTDYPYEGLPRQIKGLGHLVLVNNPPHHAIGDFSLENGIVKKDSGPLLNFGGIGVYRHALFDDCLPGIFPVAPLLVKAIEKGLLTGEHYQGAWDNIGTPEQLNNQQ